MARMAIKTITAAIISPMATASSSSLEELAGGGGGKDCVGASTVVVVVVVVVVTVVIGGSVGGRTQFSLGMFHSMSPDKFVSHVTVAELFPEPKIRMPPQPNEYEVPIRTRPSDGSVGS